MSTSVSNVTTFIVLYISCWLQYRAHGFTELQIPLEMFAMVMIVAKGADTRNNILHLYVKPLVSKYQDIDDTVCKVDVVENIFLLSAIYKPDKLAANVMESLLLNGICVNLIGIYCFWSYVQLRNETLLISSIYYVTKLNGQTQSVLPWDRWDSREGKRWVQGSHLKWSLPSH